MAYDCSSISEDLNRFVRNFQHLSTKLFLFIATEQFLARSLQSCSETITKTILCTHAAVFLQICANLQKSRNNMMPNQGAFIEKMDLSHILVAVFVSKKQLQAKNSRFVKTCDEHVHS